MKSTINWTEITTIAGQMHNKKMFGTLTDADEKRAIRAIMDEINNQ